MAVSTDLFPSRKHFLKLRLWAPRSLEGQQWKIMSYLVQSSCGSKRVSLPITVSLDSCVLEETYCNRSVYLPFMAIECLNQFTDMGSVTFPLPVSDESIKQAELMGCRVQHFSLFNTHFDSATVKWKDWCLWLKHRKMLKNKKGHRLRFIWKIEKDIHPNIHPFS